MNAVYMYTTFILERERERERGGGGGGGLMGERGRETHQIYRAAG